MSNKYRYDHQSHKHRKRHAFMIFSISAFVVAILAIVILTLINQTTKKINSVSGATEVVGTVSDNPASSEVVINEPYYTFNIPNTWKMIKSVSNPVQNSITWESFEKDATNRYFTVYTDPIPPTYPVNLELPVEAHGSTLSFGSLSDNCADFTNTTGVKSLVPVLAKWQDVNFWCNSPNYVDNQVGTGSVGAVNSVALTGPDSGTHHYFFLYIDRNTSPDYSILYSILNSFQAK
jgi:hypothetical protein